jgi:hypothetical protein
VTLNVAVPVESVVAVELEFELSSVNVTTVLGTGWFKVVFVKTALNVTVPPVAGMSVVLALNVRLYVYETPSMVTVILLLYTVAIFFHLLQTGCGVGLGPKPTNLACSVAWYVLPFEQGCSAVRSA